MKATGNPIEYDFAFFFFGYYKIQSTKNKVNLDTWYVEVYECINSIIEVELREIGGTCACVYTFH